MDARVLHRGGPRNKSPQPDTPRTLLYFTVQREGTAYDSGHTPSLLPEYRGRLPLREWAVWLASGPLAREIPASILLLQQSLASVSSGTRGYGNDTADDDEMDGREIADAAGNACCSPGYDECDSEPRTPPTPPAMI